MEQKLDQIILNTHTILTAKDLFNNIAKIKNVNASSGIGSNVGLNIALYVTEIKQNMYYCYKRNTKNNTHYAKHVVGEDSALLSNNSYIIESCTLVKATLKAGWSIDLVLFNNAPGELSEIQMFLSAYNESKMNNGFKLIHLECDSKLYQGEAKNKSTGNTIKAKYKSKVSFSAI